MDGDRFVLNTMPIQRSDIEEMAASFGQIGWSSKGLPLFQQYLLEHGDGLRTVLVARVDGTFAGYVTILWRSSYPLFAQEGIPEISDLNVLPRFRRQGVGSLLMSKAEGLIAVRSTAVGIGVGLHEDYGAAQRLYVRRGYVPDGHGITTRHSRVTVGESVVADDDLVLWFTKAL